MPHLIRERALARGRSGANLPAGGAGSYTRRGSWIGPGGPPVGWLARPPPGGHGLRVVRCREAPPGKTVPVGRHLRVSPLGSRGRRGLGPCGGGHRGRGGAVGAPGGWLLFPWVVARPGTSAAALVPGAASSSLRPGPSRRLGRRGWRRCAGRGPARRRLNRCAVAGTVRGECGPVGLGAADAVQVFSDHGVPLAAADVGGQPAQV
jgi:hypothetical protein